MYSYTCSSIKPLSAHGQNITAIKGVPTLFDHYYQSKGTIRRLTSPCHLKDSRYLKNASFPIRLLLLAYRATYRLDTTSALLPAKGFLSFWGRAAADIYLKNSRKLHLQVLQRSTEITLVAIKWGKEFVVLFHQVYCSSKKTHLLLFFKFSAIM